MNFAKLRYGFGAIPRRFVQPQVCPCCGTRKSSRVDRKGFHELRRCAGCALLFRWPCETAAEMARFYQRTYTQPGLTTDLPDPETLKHLMSTGFKGSGKDFSRVIHLFECLGIPNNARILDYGANWGYGVFQFREAGYNAIGYEISMPMVEFADQLDVKVFDEWQACASHAPFDLVFSAHVLEHTPNPASALDAQMAVLRGGGGLWLFSRMGPNRFGGLSRRTFIISGDRSTQ